MILMVLTRFFLGAKMDKELFKLSLMPVLRQRLRTTLATNYFGPGIQTAILEN